MVLKIYFWYSITWGLTLYELCFEYLTAIELMLSLWQWKVYVILVMEVIGEKYLRRLTGEQLK